MRAADTPDVSYGAIRSTSSLPRTRSKRGLLSARRVVGTCERFAADRGRRDSLVRSPGADQHGVVDHRLRADQRFFGDVRDSSAVAATGRAISRYAAAELWSLWPTADVRWVGRGVCRPDMTAASGRGSVLESSSRCSRGKGRGALVLGQARDHPTRLSAGCGARHGSDRPRSLQAGVTRHRRHVRQVMRLQRGWSWMVCW
jgi:hypothetical protein